MAEQQDLRYLMQAPRSSPDTLAETPLALAPCLENLGLERLWGLAGGLRLEGLNRALPGALTQGLYLVVYETLSNATRHAGASAVYVALSVQATAVRLIVRDNGLGFPCRVHYDLAALMALCLGPRMLRERMVALGGDFTIDSTAARTCLSITVPLIRPGAQECRFAS